MKTAISISDEILRQADDFAKQRGMTRSKLDSDAVSEYLARRRREEITAKLNGVLTDEPNRLDPVLARIQAASIGRDEW